MTRKIFLSVIILCFAAVIASLTMAMGVSFSYTNDMAAIELENGCDIIASSVESGGKDYLRSTSFGTLHVMWIDPKGHPLFNSVESESEISGDMLITAERQLSDGSVIRISSMKKSFWEQLAMCIKPILLTLLLLTLISLGAAIVLAKWIVRPINEIDLDQPNASEAYHELSPLLDKLSKQNNRVYTQMEELRQSRRQFSIITENMSEGLVVADQKAIILTCNTGAYTLLESRHISAGHSIFGLSSEASFRRCIQDAMGGRKSECILTMERGERKVIASPAKVSEYSDSLNGIVVFILDVTEQQQLEAMRREFTSNVSHELKTPLTSIYGISDMLANGLVRPEDVASFGNNIRNESERLMNIIGDIISLSKLDENFVPAQDEQVDLYELAADIICRLSKAAASKKVTAMLSGEHVIVTGKRTNLDEIITNLCDNAIKYNVEGGSYDVHVAHENKMAVITVSDTGIGIPAEHINRIFERFYRVDKSRSRKIKGTGLGLSIVKHGVSYHGGTVRASSGGPGKGTKFTVELEMTRQEVT